MGPLSLNFGVGFSPLGTLNGVDLLTGAGGLLGELNPFSEFSGTQFSGYTLPDFSLFQSAAFRLPTLFSFDSPDLQMPGFFQPIWPGFGSAAYYGGMTPSFRFGAHGTHRNHPVAEDSPVDLPSAGGSDEDSAVTPATSTATEEVPPPPPAEPVVVPEVPVVSPVVEIKPTLLPSPSPPAEPLAPPPAPPVTVPPVETPTPIVPPPPPLPVAPVEVTPAPPPAPSPPAEPVAPEVPVAPKAPVVAPVVETKSTPLPPPSPSVDAEEDPLEFEETDFSALEVREDEMIFDELETSANPESPELIARMTTQYARDMNQAYKAAGYLFDMPEKVFEWCSNNNISPEMAQDVFSNWYIVDLHSSRVKKMEGELNRLGLVWNNKPDLGVDKLSRKLTKDNREKIINLGKEMNLISLVILQPDEITPSDFMPDKKLKAENLFQKVDRYITAIKQLKTSAQPRS